jgi:hypothetical protein
MRRVLPRLLLALLVIAGISLLGWGLLHRFFEAMYSPVEASAQELVYSVDHQKVLEACHEVEAHRDAHAKPELIDGIDGGAALSALPTALRELKPEMIAINQTGVTIYFGGGFGHWGLAATREEPMDLPNQGSVEQHWQLIPGLWFWSEYGRFPADPAKPPLLRVSTLYIFGGVAVFGLSAVLWRLTNRRRIQKAVG